MRGNSMPSPNDSWIWSRGRERASAWIVPWWLPDGWLTEIGAPAGAAGGRIGESAGTKIPAGATEYASANSRVCPSDAATLTVQWQAQVTFAGRPFSMV